MKTNQIITRGLALLAFSALNLQPSTIHAQGTAFMYQGRLNDGASPATGIYDIQFAIYDSTNSPGILIAGPLTNSATCVTNGLFTATLDFGGGVFTGTNYWLELGARTNGAGAFIILSPRQQILPTPYAIYSANAATAVAVSGNVPAGQLAGTVPLAQLPAAVVTNGASGLNLSGTFTGDGAGLTGVDLRTVNSFGSISFTADNYPGIFTLASSPDVGSQPYSVTAADVNGDGKLDLISANEGNNTLTVLTNNGSGGFVLAATLGVGNNPDSVVAADVNGDGRVDLISANLNANTLTVLTNDGSGSFVLAASPGVGNNPRSVTAADVNGDGRVDLISANYNNSGTLTVLTNDGSGGFVLAATLSVDTYPTSVTAADVNGDGKPDLISANYFANTLTVLTNNGGGGFVLASSPVVGGNPISIVAADVNGDGKLDLICAKEFASTLTVLTNNGSGGFVLAASPGVGNGPRSVTAADVNGDGKLDLICANINASRQAGTLTVLTNSGSGGFGLATTLSVGQQPYSVVAADVNGDGKVDLICANLSDNTLTVLFNTPAGFTANFIGNGAGLTGLNGANVAGVVGSAAYFTGSLIGDVTGTQTATVVASVGGQTAANVASGAIAANAATSANVPNTIVKRDGSGNFSAGAITANTVAGTFSGDGAGLTGVDLRTLNSEGAIAFSTNHGVNFLPASTPGAGSEPLSVTAADVNGDGKPDLVCANFTTNTLTVLTNNGSGDFVPASTPGAGSGPYSVAAADVNGDGKPDLISANTGDNTLTLLTNDGAGGFVLSATLPVGNFPVSVVAADMNGDGKVDLTCSSFFDNTLTVLTNDGSGGFAPAATLGVGNQPFSVTTADVNGDGKVDLISANASFNTLTVLTNDGSGGWVVSSSPDVGSQPYSVTAADVNEDGKPDLVCANFGTGAGNTLTVLTNDGSGGFVLASSPVVGAGPAWVTAADVNGDGKPDLISANESGNTLTVLTNIGSGVFATAATLVTGSTPDSVAAADVNGDGKVDLINANGLDNTLTVWLSGPPVVTADFTGNGAGLTGLVFSDASQLTNGTVADARLSANVALLDATQTFTGANTLNNPANAFAGDGSGLTGLNASAVTGGTLADGQLSANVALRAGGNAFTGNQILTGGNAGIGTASPQESLVINGGNAFIIGENGGYPGANGSLLFGSDDSTRDGALVRSTGGDLSFWRYNGGWYETMRIANGSGYIGIGKPAPAAALDVSGMVSADAFLGNGEGLTDITGASIADGQVVKSLNGLNDAVTLSAGANIILTPSGNNIQIAAGGSGVVSWQEVTDIAQQAQPNSGYLLENSGQTIVTLPVSPNPGDIVRVSGVGSGGWEIAQNAGQSILAAHLSLVPGLNWTAHDSSRHWQAVASSSDGTKLVAVVRNGGQIYTSTDSGATWTARANSLNWQAVASSSDGTKLVAAVNGPSGQIYTSTDSGVTWAASVGSLNWQAVASSSDGTKLVAAVINGRIYTSTDSGVTWTTRDSNRSWQAVASSADGTKLVAVVNSGQIYTSTDSGATWTARDSNRSWQTVASSSDGTKLVAAVSGGRIYTSTDSGVSWTQHDSNRSWQTVASSSDGSKLVAGVTSDHVFTSTDSGVTWTPRDNIRHWQSIASSSDGNKLVAAVDSGLIYISDPTSPSATTTLGTAGYLLGAQSTAIELQYIGNSQFLPISHEGTILGY